MSSPLITVVGSFAVGMTLPPTACRSLEKPCWHLTLTSVQAAKVPTRPWLSPVWGSALNSVGLLGKDTLGDIARQLYTQEGVQTDNLATTEAAATGVGFIIVNPEGKNGIPSIWAPTS